MWKCRMCGKEYNDMEKVMECESKCFPEYNRKRKEDRNKELTIDMNKLNTLRQEYIRFMDKVENKYNKEELDNFKGLFNTKDYSACDDKSSHIGNKAKEMEALEDWISYYF